MEPLPLRDLHLPAPIGWWPPAPGWWLLALSAVGLVLLLARWIRRRRRRVAPLRLALQALDRLAADPHSSPDDKLRQLSILVRRVALSLYPREQVAGLVGEAWLRWLDQTLGEAQFSQGPGRWLAEAPYRPAPEADLEALLALCRSWLKALSKVPETRRPVAGRDVLKP